ncbi:hypothetical protein CEN47_29205 [Fischerella thermalis CCMEE 5319]|nr:hypothetical protein CEN47_29205 [Fischerella thermalis CCMEE 5319]
MSIHNKIAAIARANIRVSQIKPLSQDFSNPERGLTVNLLPWADVFMNDFTSQRFKKSERTRLLKNSEFDESGNWNKPVLINFFVY